MKLLECFQPIGLLEDKWAKQRELRSRRSNALKDLQKTQKNLRSAQAIVNRLTLREMNLKNLYERTDRKLAFIDGRLRRVAPYKPEKPIKELMKKRKERKKTELTNLIQNMTKEQKELLIKRLKGEK